MNGKQFSKVCLSLIRSPVNTSYALDGRRASGSVDLRECIRSGSDWLLKAQERALDGEGYSRRYSLISGWDRCYIETTGYIIPTLIDVAGFLGEQKYRDSATRAGYWLLTVQGDEGAFAEIDSHRPLVFDTGQVLLGLNRMFRETGDEKFRDSALKAARWLVDVQEENGCWLRFAYNDRPHAYYSRVAAALIETGLMVGDQEFVEAGRRNLDWVSEQEQDNGYFRFSEFRPGEDALLHTLVYVIEGFSMAFDLTGEQRWADTLVRGASALKRLVNEEGLLYSQYDPSWRPANTEYCVTGLAQFAGACFDVHRINGEAEFRALGDGILQRLCGWQLDRGHDMTGALPSSIPVWGYYGGMSFFNWNSKFFLDAALKSLTALRLETDLFEGSLVVHAEQTPSPSYDRKD